MKIKIEGQLKGNSLDLNNSERVRLIEKFELPKRVRLIEKGTFIGLIFFRDCRLHLIENF